MSKFVKTGAVVVGALALSLFGFGKAFGYGGGGGGGSAVPVSTASQGGIAIIGGAPVAIPTPVIVSSPSISTGEVLGVEINVIDELLAKVKFGMTSDDVKQLQTALQNQGYFSKSLNTTRYYGLVTRAAVAKYLATKTESMTVAQLATTLKLGARGNAVVKLQAELKRLGFFPANVGTSGYFGLVTKAAVAKYLAK
jgi:hypothetical protein